MSNDEPQFTLPDLDFGIKAPESEPYLGIIVRDEITRSVFDGEEQTQWAWAVRPVFGRPPGETGLWHGWATIPTLPSGEVDTSKLRSTSKLMRVIDSFKAVFGTHDAEGNTLRPGRGSFIGAVATFQNKSWKYGRGATATESKAVPVPIHKASDEEIEAARSLPEYVPPVRAADASAPAAVKVALELTPELLVLGRSLYVGHTRAEAARAAMKAADLSEENRRDVVSGALLAALVAAGHLVVGDDGRGRAPGKE